MAYTRSTPTICQHCQQSHPGTVCELAQSSKEAAESAARLYWTKLVPRLLGDIKSIAETGEYPDWVQDATSKALDGNRGFILEFCKAAMERLERL